MEHLRVSKGAKGQKLDAFFNRRQCCVERYFALKVYLEYKDAAEIMECGAFRKLLQTWIVAPAFTNMWSDRLLARFRRNCRIYGTPDSERLISTGMLSHMFAGHKKLGYDDTRVQSKEALLEAGVPLQCQKPELRRSSDQL